MVIAFTCQTRHWAKNLLYRFNFAKKRVNTETKLSGANLKKLVLIELNNV